MGTKNNDRLFYICSLIEYIGRTQRQTRKAVIDYLGREQIERIYEYADVFHCEPIEKVAGELIATCHIERGIFDNVSECCYRVPDYWDIGEVHARLIEDCFADSEVTEGIIQIYHSWIEPYIADYNTDLYYQPRDYIAACYKEGEIL